MKEPGSLHKLWSRVDQSASWFSCEKIYSGVDYRYPKCSARCRTQAQELAGTPIALPCIYKMRRFIQMRKTSLLRVKCAMSLQRLLPECLNRT